MAFCIRQKALPASSAERLESTANSWTRGGMKDSATRGAKVRLYPDNDRADRASELTTAVSWCVSELQ
jgi:hypothetical protein